MSITILTPPARYTLSERVTYLCQMLKPHPEWADVVRLLQSKEKASRKGKGRKQTAKRAQVVARDGRRSKAYVNLANPEIQYIENQRK